VAFVTLLSFVAGTLSPAWARAESPESPPSQEIQSVEQTEKQSATSEHHAAVEEPKGQSVERPAVSSGASNTTPTADPSPSAVSASPPTLASLPGGADKTGVSSQAISVPQGAGKIQGMGESFSAQLSTGIATFNIPISLLAARGAAQPSLALSYSSGGGQSIAGMGWSIGVPFIARQTDRGIPKYNDPANSAGWYPEQDRFVFNGGQELVPICLVSGNTCSATLPEGEVMPTDIDMTGWQYFRPRVEGSFQRFFWSPDHRTWRVQDKSGVTMELGVALDGKNDANALETDPSDGKRIFRWNLSREFDAHVEANPPANTKARPVNVVYFRYETVQGEAYLTDIYDTSPAANPAAAALSDYAHHSHLWYEDRPDPTTSYRRGWQTAMTRRLVAVDVASKTFAGDVTAPRHQVRRYHLGYDHNYHVSLLKSVQVEGRCSGDEASAPAEGSGERLSQPLPPSANSDTPATACPALPAMTLDYQHVLPFDTSGQPGTVDLVGYEGFDERIHTMANSPDHSVDEELTDLFDINSDGLPDVLVTAPGLYGGKHGVFFNGGDGTADSFKAGTIGVSGVLGASASDITLKNLNISAQDVDGDGTIDLLHMPAVKTYSVYTPQGSGNSWNWVGRVVNTASQQSPKIDFGRDTLDLRVMDVNADGLVDVVFSGGTEFQTFLSLGRYPGGDGQFGSATWAGATTASISNDPIRTCVPWDSTPVHFSDPDIKLGDMNGDGLVDIVRIRKGDIRYWPGRGNGVWGTGSTTDCTAGTFGPARNITMSGSPQYSDIQGDSLRLDDVNGDGLDDLVQVRFDAVDVWLNVDGVGWTPNRHIIQGTPPSPSYANRVRLVDVNGSGTRDILWGNGLGYKYIDLAGGAQPWVLTHVANGLGKTTDLEYSTSTAQMLAAQRAGSEWQSKAPMPLHIVTRVTDSDNLEIVGRPAGKYVTEYTYRDPVYDGRQREFRGFRHAEAKKIGDDNSPTSIGSSDFLLGECKDQTLGDGTQLCAPANRWRDNGREALKGLPVLTEARDELGTYLLTAHQTYTLRPIYAGLDGRTVTHGFQSATDSYTYDTGPFVAGGNDPLSLDDVVVEPPTGTSTHEPGTIPRRSSAAKRTRTQSQATVDKFGNALDQIALGCTEGCPDGVDEIITSHTEPARPTGDASGWLWRTVHSYVNGSAHSDVARRNERSITNNSQGDPIQTSMVLSGTLPLKRRHETLGALFASDPPPGASDPSAEPRTATLMEQTPDQFGNMTAQTGANGRCRQVGFDDDYAELAIEEAVYAGAFPPLVTPGPPPFERCGIEQLVSKAQYDRGLAVVTQATDLHGEITLAGYDGLGRVTSLTKPDPVALTASALPSVKVEYFLTTDPAKQPYSLLHTQTQDGATPSDAEYMEAWAYVDGLGRTIVTLAEADPGAGDGGDFVVNGLTEYDNKGAERRKFLAWFYSGDPTKFPLASPPPSPYGRQRYDAFGRQVETFGLDGSITLSSVHHPLATDLYDAADIEPGPHQGTFVTTRKDGHGRDAAMVERIHAGTAIEARETRTTYLPTGEPEVITRERMTTHEKVIRWMRYDSQGRRVLNVEPNTSAHFDPSPAANADGIDAWRYAYNDAGELVGTSDARGCGVDYHHEGAGRLVGEDYSPCLPTHEPYSKADPVARTGFEVLYKYDHVEADHPTDSEYACNDGLLLGRLVSVSDRGSKVLTCYDGRGRVTTVAKRITKPDAIGPVEDRYAPRWYIQTSAYDGADRPVSVSTAARVPELMGTGNASRVDTSYSRRGIVRSVGGSYGSLVANLTKDADGLPQQIVYGDAAATTTAFQYDNRRRLRSVQTYRGPPAIWTTPPGNSLYDGYAVYSSGTRDTFQLLLQDEDFIYDSVDNPIEIRDWRLQSEWLTGAKPVTRKIQYDDLYRLARIDYQYGDRADSWTDPFATEDTGPGSIDPKRAKPVPHQSFDQRMQRQTFTYDWLGNTTSTDDDTHAFYDRSLGKITNGTATNGPYQLQGASNASTPPTTPSRKGSLSAVYDSAGNLKSLLVQRGTVSSDAPCLPTGSTCWHRFAYDWDEVGRLVEARRWDLPRSGIPAASDPVPSAVADVALRYAYDAGDVRTLKTAIDAAGGELHTAYISDSLELRRAHYELDDSEVALDYERSAATETVYLNAGGVRLARVAEVDAVPNASTAKLHVLLELEDQLGSTTTVLDKATGELVEACTYQAYGGAESDYRPGRWGEFRDDYRFTGKEEDAEVGLSYFGRRFLSTQLNRWLSADPLGVHSTHAELNTYAYVHGQVLRAIDPLGLAATAEQTAEFKEAEQTYLANKPGLEAAEANAQKEMEDAVKTGDPDAVSGAYDKWVKASVDRLTNESQWAEARDAYYLLNSGISSVSTGDPLRDRLNLNREMEARIDRFNNAVETIKRSPLTSIALAAYVVYKEHEHGQLTPEDRRGADTLVSVGGAIEGLVTGAAAVAVAVGRRPERVGRLPQDVAVGPKAPDALPLNRPVGMSAAQNAQVQADIAAARAQGARDFRVNQQQLDAAGQRVGINRPDLQYTLNGVRVHIEYDTPSSGRGPDHADRILANDPSARVILKIIK
jgi:RHS repeat-associated protein